jgi:TolB protein
MMNQLLKAAPLLAVAVIITQTNHLDAEGQYTVAFASFAPLNSAVFIADADGNHARVLVEHSALDSNPSFSPDGRWVLFTSRRDGSAEIYRVQLDGAGLERLTHDPAFDDQAVMSPDGNHVAFVSSRSGQADIWILDLRTKRFRNLTNHPGGDYRPAWSPDGQWIAFTSDRDSDGARANTPLSNGPFSPPQSTKIYVIRADGSGLRRLTYGEVSVGGASWSRDGKRIAFYEASAADWRTMGRDFPGPPSATSQIVSIEVATGARQILTSGPGRKFAPKWIGTERIGYIRGDANEKLGARERVNYQSAGIQYTDGSLGLTGDFSSIDWSPDGRRIVFYRDLEGEWPPVSQAFSRDPQFRLVRTGVFPSYSPDGRKLVSHTAFAGLFHNSLVVMNADDGKNRQVVFDDPAQNAVAPVWSPSGDRIAFGLGAYNRGSRAGAESHVVVIGPDGSGLRVLTSAGHGNYGFPSWAPDGKRLVFRSAQGQSKGLAIVESESGKITPLTSGAWNDNFPAWSPQGDLIVFASDRDGDWELYTIRPDGRDLKRLTRTPGNDAHPAWSPDGRWIAFASARGGFKDEIARGVGGAQGAGDIFVMRADGTDVRRLTDDASEEATPAFKPK